MMIALSETMRLEYLRIRCLPKGWLLSPMLSILPVFTSRPIVKKRVPLYGLARNGFVFSPWVETTPRKTIRHCSTRYSSYAEFTTDRSSF